MTWRDADKNEISDTHYDRIYEIRFKKKHTKSNIRLIIKLIIYLIIAGLSGALFSNALIKFKYEKIIQRIQEQSFNGSVLNLNYTNIINNVSPSLVTISDQPEKILQNKYFDNNITGVVIDSSGNIITNYSGIKNFENIFVKITSEDKEVFQGEIIVKNEHIDLAIISIKYKGQLKPIKFANIYNIKEGQGVVILGNSIGDSYVGSISPGVITSTHEKVIYEEREFSLLQLNAPVGTSNTGGPICNSNGELVGIASLNIIPSNTGESFYYGIQIEEVESIITSTNVLKNILGIIEGGVLGDEEGYRGFYVQELDKRGVAYKAGIKPTDIILEIDNYKVMTLDDIRFILKNKKKGDVLKCEVLSNGEMKTVEIKISN